jgi:CO dehydrogenase maturation factor
MPTTIAVAGKGGAGKSTVAALIIRHLLGRKAGPVLAVDADPDANLGTLLGVHAGKSVGDLREEALREIKKLPAGMSKASYIEAGLHRIIEESKGFDLITMGRGEGPGCYCYLNSLIRKFSEDLAPSYAWVVIDNEAGLEHLSRRTAGSIDALIAVVNEHPLSFDTAIRIGSIVSDMKNIVRRKLIVANRVRAGRLPAIEKRVKELPFEFAGSVPDDPALDDAVVSGRSLLSADASAAEAGIARIMETIGGYHADT